MQQEKRITAKDAAVRASEYFKEIIGPIQNISIEEIELDESGSYWLITLGYRDPESISFYKRRIYKIFKVDAYTGEVVSMKIREVEEG